MLACTLLFDGSCKVDNFCVRSFWIAGIDMFGRMIRVDFLFLVGNM